MQELVQRLVHLVLVVHGQAGDAVGAGHGGKVRGAVQGHAEGAVVGGGLLDLVDQAQGVVLEQDDLHVQVRRLDGGQLVHGHLEGAVAADHDVLPLRRGNLGPDARGQGVAHGAQAAAGEQPAVLLGQVLTGEDLVLAHVHADHRVVVQLGPQLPQEGAGEHGALPPGEDPVQLRPPVVLQLVQPGGGVGDRHAPVQNLSQNDLHVAHQGDGGLHVLADLRRVHVDVDGGHAPLDLLGVHHGPVGGPGAHHDEQIRLGQGLVGAVVAVGSDHAHVQGVVGGHQGDAHHGLDHRDGAALRQLQQLVPGVGQPHAAAGADEGLLGPGDGLHHPLDLQVVALDAGLIAPDVHRLRVLEFFRVCSCTSMGMSMSTGPGRPVEAM